MELKIIDDKIVWEGFFAGIKEKTFLQSWNWGEFYKKMGNKIFRMGIFEDDHLVLAALAAKIEAKRGTFLLIQHLSESGKESLEFLVEHLKEIGKKEGAAFIRLSPLWLKCDENQEIFKSLGFKSSPMHANTYEATWKLDITPGEEELMKNMRKTTRYLIRQTMKNPEISVEMSEKITDIKNYQELNDQVARRQKFTPFSDDYIKNEFEIFSKDNQALWFFGKFRGEIAAAALVIFWQETAFYHQAASDSKYAKLSIPYLIQWESIKEAKRRGCRVYDFWGFTDPKAYPRHPWAGPTLFKMGFGGYNEEYVKTQDLPLSCRYWPTYFFENLRKRKRGFH